MSLLACCHFMRDIQGDHTRLDGKTVPLPRIVHVGPHVNEKGEWRRDAVEARVLPIEYVERIGEQEEWRSQAQAMVNALSASAGAYYLIVPYVTPEGVCKFVSPRCNSSRHVSPLVCPRHSKQIAPCPCAINSRNADDLPRILLWNHTT